MSVPASPLIRQDANILTSPKFIRRAITLPAAENHTLVAHGGGGPHDPDMEPRVIALEADMKDVKASLGRIEMTLAVVAEGMKHLATKAELGAATGSINSLSVKVDGLSSRLDGVEKTVGTALTTAVGKAIGPGQFLTILIGAVAVFGTAVTAYRWLLHQPWFVG